MSVSYTHLDVYKRQMYQVGKKLPPELRETALGGCAATPTGCRFAKQLLKKANV